MITISSRAVAIVFASLLLTGSAFAQTTTPATPAPAAKTAAEPKMAPAEKKAEKPRTAASLECSTEADAKGLKGKERKKFRSECKKAAADKAK
jgi:phosphate-selective porin